ncbi:response regulator transcription factor [Schumannella luteola]|uniref:DNA-binding NarL/FixJ family response regulator n=1 Tax=Schumannella luteola TaxID=472059 RepID=A0A852YCL3_9MICO|nr:DNA-binding NarL/FixJ family response regulator [Schumannella luteola]TPX01492.1 response regulator transcription factor [Schumannella luteola]
MTDRIRVLIVDDQELVRLGFRMVLDAEADIEVVGEAGDGAAAVAEVRRLEPDLVLMDVRMPEMDGIRATELVVALRPDTRVLVLTTFDRDEYAFGALRAGASGFLLKDARPAELADAIRAVHRGDAVVAPRVTARLIDLAAPALEPTGRDDTVLAVLTDREREVFQLMAEGATNGEIAGRLYLSESTVKTHVGRVLRGLGLRDRVQVVILAYEIGAVKP